MMNEDTYKPRNSRGGMAPCIRAVYYKAGVVDIISRTDGLTRPGIVEIFSL